MYLLGTIFSCGLIHIWCSTEYLQQQGFVCGIDSKTTLLLFMVMKKHVTQCNSGSVNVFLIMFWTTVEQKNNLLADQFIVDFHLFMRFVDNKNNVESHQTYCLSRYFHFQSQ